MIQVDESNLNENQKKFHNLLKNKSSMDLIKFLANPLTAKQNDDALILCVKCYLFKALEKEIMESIPSET